MQKGLDVTGGLRGFGGSEQVLAEQGWAGAGGVYGR